MCQHIQCLLIYMACSCSCNACGHQLRACHSRPAPHGQKHAPLRDASSSEARLSVPPSLLTPWHPRAAWRARCLGCHRGCPLAMRHWRLHLRLQFNIMLPVINNHQPLAVAAHAHAANGPKCPRLSWTNWAFLSADHGVRNPGQSPCCDTVAQPHPGHHPTLTGQYVCQACDPCRHRCPSVARRRRPSRPPSEAAVLSRHRVAQHRSPPQIRSQTPGMRPWLHRHRCSPSCCRSAVGTHRRSDGRASKQI